MQLHRKLPIVLVQVALESQVEFTHSLTSESKANMRDGEREREECVFSFIAAQHKLRSASHSPKQRCTYSYNDVHTVIVGSQDLDP